MYIHTHIHICIYHVYRYIYIYIYSYVYSGVELARKDAAGCTDPALARYATMAIIVIFCFLTQRVFPTSSWCFCSGGGQVILQRL